MNHLYRNLLAAVLATAATCAVAQTPATITSWTTQTTVFPAANRAPQMAGGAIVGDYLYVVGGNSGADGDTSRTYRMFINKYNGFVGLAEEQAELPGRNFAYISGQTVATGTAIYITGGGWNSTNTNRSNTVIGKLNGSFQFGSGFTTTPAYPGVYDPELGAAAITQAGYLYAFGGDSQSGTPACYDTVVVAQIQPNGDLGAFSNTLVLPDVDATGATGWYFPAACSIGNYIIANPGIHSALSNANATNKVYVATTNPGTGAITAWTEQVGAPLPQPLYGTQLVAVNDTVFAIGGRTTGAAQTNVVYRATFNAGTGTLGAWQTVDAQLPWNVWYHVVKYSAASKSLYVTSQRTPGGVLDQVWISSPLFTRDAPPASADKDWALYE